MEERTFISGISELIDNVGKCKCYDDARNLLNSFVIENIGKKYETEDGTAYRNSNNPKEIKAETLRVMDDYIRKWLIIDEAATAGFNTGRKIMDKKNVIYDDGTIISVFGNMRNDIERTKSYIEAWRKEAAPIIKEEKTPRLRPIKEEVNKYIKLIFLQLKTLRYIDEQTKDTTWNYLCGVTDEVPKTPIKWIGGLFELNVLIERFLTKQSYFIVPNVAISFICSLMVDENAHEIKYDSLKSTKTREFAKNPKRVDEVWNKMKLNGML